MNKIKLETTDFNDYINFCIKLKEQQYKLHYSKKFSLLKLKTIYKVETLNLPKDFY